nr:type II toxin-antitoxin system RelE/ParE family toxin [Endozoicomonas sp.]
MKPTRTSALIFSNYGLRTAECGPRLLKKLAKASEWIYLLITTHHFDKWLKKLKDKTGKARILAALKLMEHGHIGDSKPVGQQVSELRIHYGAGYRIYYAKKVELMILLLHGGNKTNQQRDNKKAIALFRELEVEDGKRS